MKRGDKSEKTWRDARTPRRRISSRSELQRQVTELVEQQAAISEVLRAIVNSPLDLQPIFDTILANATRLCRAHLGALMLFKENDFHVVARRALKNASSDALPFQRSIGLRPGTPLSQLAKKRSPIHDANLATDQSYLDRDPGVVIVVELLGARTSLLVPMLKEDELIGAISLLRTEVQPFTEKQIELITDFAAQATIALESTRRERQYREAHMELTHATRVATLGQLSASIAHELRQPLAAIVTNGNASLRWLTRQPPEIDEAGLAVGGIIEDANRASEIIGRVHNLVTKNPVRKDLLDINEAILEVTALTHSEAIKHGVTVRTQVAHRLPRINGDKVQLQQVMLNLILNAIQAIEPPRVDRRLQLLRRWSHDEATSNKFSPEVRARAVRMVLDHEGEHPSRWVAIMSIAAKIGCTAQTLNEWVKKAEVDNGRRAGVPTDFAAKLKALERENRELRQANEILRKASAYFAQAELDRRFKP